MREQLISRLKEIQIVYRELVRLASEQISEHYIDIKRAYGFSDISNLICEELCGIMDRRITCIASSGHGGITLASVISFRYGPNLALVRTITKNHGMTTLIYGYIPNENYFVTILDDVFTTSGSIEKIADIVRQSKANLIVSLVVVKRGNRNISLFIKHIFVPEEIM